MLTSWDVSKQSVTGIVFAERGDVSSVVVAFRVAVVHVCLAHVVMKCGIDRRCHSTHHLAGSVDSVSGVLPMSIQQRVCTGHSYNLHE